MMQRNKFAVGVPRPKVDILGSEVFKDLRKDYVSIGFNSGINFLDLPTASVEYDAEYDVILPNGGLFPRPYTAIGESGTGKSSAMIQWAGGVVDNYYGAQMVFMDAEGHTTLDRIASLCYWTEEESLYKCRYVPPSPYITANDVYNMARRILHQKKAEGKKIKLKTPFKDRYTGEDIYVYPPTVIIVDSIPQLTLPKVEEDAVTGKGDFKNVEALAPNTSGLNEAKINTDFLRRIKPVLDEGNICLLAINHTVKEVMMGMFDRPKVYHPGFPAGVKLKGGNEQIFQTFCLPFITSKSAIKEKDNTYGDRIRGHISNIQYVKVKTNVGNTEFSYIFDNLTGIRYELTDFEYLYKMNMISGNPTAMFLEILPEIKFSRKNLVDKCEANPILPRALSFLANAVMGEISIHKSSHRGKKNMFSVTEFAKMPYNDRVSIIMGMSMPYAGYNVNFNHSGAYDECMKLEEIKIMGDLRTSFGERYGDYISSVNFDVVDQYVYCINKGFYPVGRTIDTQGKKAVIKQKVGGKVYFHV